MIQHLLSNNHEADTMLGTRIDVILFNPHRNPSNEDHYLHLQMRKQTERLEITYLRCYYFKTS